MPTTDDLLAVPPPDQDQDAHEYDDQDSHEDDEYVEAHAGRRSRLTTGLLVALIFLLGMLAGVLVGRALASDPAPRVVYLLSDTGSTAAPATPAAGSKSSR